MIFIAHRGLFNGPDETVENSPRQIAAALSKGFDVEIDVWVVDGKFYLGHEKPAHEVPAEFFWNHKFWLHCKNVEALAVLANHPCCESFFHDKDDVVLTSRNFLWTYPKAEILLTKNSVAVLPERVESWQGLENCYGICSDYVTEYSKDINFKVSKE